MVMQWNRCCPNSVPPLSSKTMQIKPLSFSRNSKTSLLFQALCLVASAFPDKPNTWSFLLQQHMTRMSSRLLGIELGGNSCCVQRDTVPYWKKRWEKIIFPQIEYSLVFCILLYYIYTHFYCLARSTVHKISSWDRINPLKSFKTLYHLWKFLLNINRWWQNGTNSVSILYIFHQTGMWMQKKER